MRFFLNDLSIAGQFPDAAAFCAELSLLLAARHRSGLIRTGLMCSRTLSDRPATATQTFRAAVQSNPDRDTRQRILAWLAQDGPFWEDDRASVTDDLFHFDGEDVTLQGLGEAARRQLIGGDDASYSLRGSRHPCDGDELPVLHGLVESPNGEIPVPNHVSPESMQRAAIDALPFPASWTDLVARLELKYDSLSLSPDIEGILRPHPFNVYVADRVLELLGTLDRLVKSRDGNGKFTPASYLLISNFFSGTRARFTDESSPNKSKFKVQMTFPDPDNPGRTIFCPFHGKINHPAYRIHLRWPLESYHDKIYIAYIGPKITR